MHVDQWPTDAACPPWCNGSHDHLEAYGASHRSDPRSVPAIERRHGTDGLAFDHVAAGDLTVGVESRWGDTWVWISPEDNVRRGLVLSKESAHRLARMLVALFEERLL